MFFYRICAFPGLGVPRTAGKAPPTRVPSFFPDLLKRRFTRVTARSALRAALYHVGPEVTCEVFRAIFFSNPGDITRSALRIPVPMGPNPGRWSYGVVAVLDER